MFSFIISCLTFTCGKGIRTWSWIVHCSLTCLQEEISLDQPPPDMTVFCSAKVSCVLRLEPPTCLHYLTCYSSTAACQEIFSKNEFFAHMSLFKFAASPGNSSSRACPATCGVLIAAYDRHPFCMVCLGLKHTEETLENPENCSHVLCCLQNSCGTVIYLPRLGWGTW